MNLMKPELRRYVRKPVRHYCQNRDGSRFITVYATCQMFGGPEEGGWWYYNHVQILSRKIRTRWSRRRLHREITNAVRLAALISEAEESDDLQWYFENVAGENTTTRRPRYE